MKFSDKLTVLRKKNNLSQEALAEKLNMSRQAISKWENGSSYPDMATLINICKVLNCTIDELLDDDAVGTNTFEKNTKINPNKWLKDILDFITKTYNMFWSMKLLEKIKCLIELSIIILIFFFASFLIGIVLRETVLELFRILPYNIYYYFYAVFKTIYSLFMVVIGFIIVIHLFKIRYLDYYVTIEDESINNKAIEKEIDKKEVKAEDKKFVKRKKEKIIIRDPKHTTYSFFTVFAKLMIFILKFFLIIMLIPSVIIFIIFSILGTIFIIWFKYGLIFVGLFILILGALLVNYIFIELFYNFIISKVNKLKKLFIIFISGLVVFGIGCGITLTELSKFEFVENSLNIKQDNLILNVDSDTIFHDLEYNRIKIDNNEKNIIININYSEQIKPYITEYNQNEFSISYDYTGFNIIKYILEDIKNKKISNYDIDNYEVNYIIISQKNYDMILKNNKKSYHQW